MSGRRYSARLVAAEPISVGAEAEVAFRRDVYRYIPGTVLRGALAAIWIGRYGPPTDGNRVQEFRSLFEVALRPGPLLSDGSWLRPLSVSRCKYPIDAAHQIRSVRDEAFNARPESSDICGVDGCQGPIERGRGDIEFDEGTDPVESITHVTHDGDRAADSGLHSRRYLRAGTEFLGTLIGPTTVSFLDEFTQPADVWLGARRTVAGRAELQLIPAPPPPQHDDLPPGSPLVIRLVSAGIFADDFGRPTSHLPLDEVADALGVAPATLHVQRRWRREARVGGWHAATSLPKPADRTVVSGSTWVLTCDLPVRGERLTALCDGGIGLRRAEGFGQVTVATEPWRPRPIPPPSGGTPEVAIVEAAALWRFVGRSQRAGDSLLSLLRELGRRPAQEWPEVRTSFAEKAPGRHLDRAGAFGAIDALIARGNPGLLRDVRHIVAARRLPGPHPEWLRRQLPDANTFRSPLEAVDG